VNEAPQVCSKCGTALNPGAKFCNICGQTTSMPIANRTASAPALPPIPSVSAAANQPSASKHPHQNTARVSGPRLQVRFPGKPVEEVELENQLTIGRGPDNDLVIPIASISRHHAQITCQAGKYQLVDLGSSNGTYLMGQRIPAQIPQPLTQGAVIRIGDQLGNSASLTYLDVYTPMQPANVFKLDEMKLGEVQRFTIGRDPQSILHLDTPVVSWRHAVVVRSGQGYTIQDLGSTNGTYVNGQRIRQSVLHPGDTVQIGPYKLDYSPAAGGFTQSSNIGNVRLDGLHLVKEVNTNKGRKAILNNVSLSILPREFIALVGGSGAGKTTLMDALNGFRRSPQGRVLVNGDDLYRNYDAYRPNMGYVPQSDILHTGLTIRHALRYTALLRLPQDTGWKAINQRIQQVLQQVDMLEQIDQPITSLSGGQRKRVSIAAELLSDPNLFFLDEPTSGLDPGLDKRMMFTLNTLADAGRTIVLTTHATNNIIGQCDHVAFMSDGRLVYYGPPEQAIQFFGAVDFADIYSKVDKPKGSVHWESQFKGSTQYQQYVVDRQNALKQNRAGSSPRRNNLLASFNPLRPLRQFGILAWRYIDLILNSLFRMFILLAVMPIIGILLLFIANAKALVGDTPGRIDQILQQDGYYNIANDAQKLLLMLALSVILLGVFAAAYEIVRERPIYARERMVNLGILPYLASKVAVLIGFGLAQCFALLLVVGLKVSFPWDGVLLPAILEMFITLVLALLVGISMGLFVSALVKNDSVVIYLVLVVLFIQIIFSGVLFELPGPAKALSYLTPTRWAMEGLGASVDMERLNDLSQSFIEMEVETDLGPIEVNEPVDAPMDFTINYSSSGWHLTGTWIMQLIFVGLFLGGTGVVLKVQDHLT
jgi:ABC-type multidrug transport system ATPase subunit/pSer/pThr/pTyr-binding forkhead associated (FHA) protein